MTGYQKVSSLSRRPLDTFVPIAYSNSTTPGGRPLTPEHDPEPSSLAEIVREQTNDGLVILEFLINASRGDLEDFDDTHRLEAAHRLLNFFIGFAILRRSPPDSTLAIVLSNDLGLFKEVVGFETEAVEGRCEGVAVRQRIVLAEQLRRCMRLVRSTDAAPNAARFSRVLRSETHGGSRIDRFLRNVAGGGLPGATPDDVRNARKLLES